MNSSPYAGWRALLKFGAFVLLCSLPWTAQAQTPQALADSDGNGLIEIDSLLMLHNMRYNLAGTSYKTTSTASVVGDSSGCPDATGCIGYELTDNLDFDVNGDGTWSGNAEDGFTLDMDDNEAVYFPVDVDGAGGWLPIGSGADRFVAVFDGKGHTISNLAIRHTRTHIGLFGATGSDAVFRNLGLVDNLADYTGSSDSGIYIGGLVGLFNGSITASYATGNADGGGGDFDNVGGLVGSQVSGSSITASYATGDAHGGSGQVDRVGGLVGEQKGGSITASYATGDAHGGDGAYDYVGGLVGEKNGGSITASYATGDAHGGNGSPDRVGGLMGRQDGGSITESYGFGRTIGGKGRSDDGSTKPPDVSTAAQLTADNAGSAWNDADSNTLGAWDFGTNEQIPALNYADYDGAGTVFDCSQFPAGACETQLPRQADVNATGLSAVAFGANTTITGSLVFGRVTIVSWSWEQLQGPNVTLMGADSRTATFTAPTTGDLLLFELTATDSGGDQYTDRILLSLGASVDHDGDGLIEIDSLTMLHNMRYNLAGTSYKESASAPGAAYGCPAVRCRGYELTRNLDFDVNGDGSTWSDNAEDGFTLDMGDHEADYFPVDADGAGGWLPIGNGTSPFVAVFDGKGHTISNLAIRRNQSYIGLFGATGGGIRNLGLVDNLADYTGSSNGNIYIGGLVGLQDTGSSITASYATGDADGGDGNNDRIGGLVGRSKGSITASYATGDADGGDGNDDAVGGLVGLQGTGSSITASYATGDADGGDGNTDRVGGLVGWQGTGSSITASYATGDADGGVGNNDRIGGLVGQSEGSITASYATGDADGGDGNDDAVGGLVGLQDNGGSITASYATGDADGGGGSSDRAGGLVGVQEGGSITASYATGDADGGDGNNDRVGGLVGLSQGSITASYGFGGTIGGEAVGSDGSTKPQGVSTAAQLTEANAGSAWNSAANNTLGAWDFGTNEQIPALNYADYDGTGNTFDCSQFPAGACETQLPLHAEVNATGLSAVAFGATTTITGSLVLGHVTIVSWSWVQLQGLNVTLMGADSRTAIFRAPATGDLLLFELTATDSGGDQYTDRILLSLGASVDQDGDGLIEIDSLAMLHNMRHNLAGTSYKESASALGAAYGCPAARCRGYELTRNLDFDVNGDGSTWSGNAEDGFTLDLGDHKADYFPVDADGADGWLPIGNEANPFVAVFDGKGHTISNLAIRRDQSYVGLFGATGGGIRNLGLVDNLADYTGSSNGNIYIGGLVGFQDTGSSLTASYATGDADGGDGNNDRIGGLVGQSEGSITASYATGDADGGDGNNDRIGGLVGQSEGSITASYATGDADGGDGNSDLVGGLVGLSRGSITASYATGDADGGNGNEVHVGGLVGRQGQGSITASHATGDADSGNGGFDRVGGLVGDKYQGSITASYATGDADGGGGGNDRVGGLVGHQREGSITASYATGDADGGVGNSDRAGGLVGVQEGGLITASYATGDADGGVGNSDRAGGLVGHSQDTIVASYGFGGTIGEEISGSDGSTKPQGVSTAAQLTADNAGSAWNSAVDNTLGAWDFGTDEQIPALNYADYDGVDPAVFDCGQFPANACGTLLPGQDEVSASGTSAVAFGANTTITGSLVFGRVAIVSWSWEKLEGPNVILVDANTRAATFTAPATGDFLLFELTATDSDGDQYTDRIRLSLGASVDQDGNGLIEIDSLTMLHNMRHNLAGTSYKESASAPGAAYGCPAARCRGYELTRNLDFDVDGDGSTWSGNAEDGFTLHLEDHEANYFPVDVNGAGGWLPIGGETDPFVAVFDGNTHTISNLAIRRNQTYVGLFGKIGNSAAIRNLGLVDNLADYTGSSNSGIFIGGLVGRQEGGSISASYATGDADGGDGRNDRVGGLVGLQRGGSITASYATGDADGGGRDSDSVGGLVGRSQGSITASYATGDADGGDGDYDTVGGLVGWQSQGSITASYATGDADGGVGDDDRVGGLVGQSQGSITASYATGDADGGVGDSDRVGGLVGQSQGSITASYGFGGTIGGEAVGSDGSPKPQGVGTAVQLTEANAGSAWNDADSNTLGAWDFGTNEQIPALNYADYDGTGNTFDCSQFPAGACGTQLPRQADVNATGLSAVAFGATTTITGSLLFGRVAIESWSWVQLQGPNVTLMGADARTATFTAPATGDLLLFELTATDSGGDQYTDRIRLSLGASVDQDGDGLIEIDSLTMLHNMRHNLAGTSYKESASALGAAYGCPAARCRGYELTRNLDFDVDGDGSTWSGNAEDGFTLHLEDHEANYFPVDVNGAGGWLPIGDGTDPFVAVFDGKGHKISNLAIRRDQTYVGLFGVTVGGIRNLGLVDNLADYTGSSDSVIYIGGLVGWQDSGSSITASYATGDADGGDGNNDRVGGLVGLSDVLSSITASYATGDADGGDGNSDHVGGLVGRQEGGSITASYATGAVAGGLGDDSVGGLVGYQFEGLITASYATGDAHGGVGNNDYVGGLVGRQDGGSITASYGFGGTIGGEAVGSDGSPKPQGVSTAAQLTAANAGSAWNDADTNTLDAWDFGTNEQIPALSYADYDGAGNTFNCSQFPTNACGTSTPILVPGQADVSASGPPTAEHDETVSLAGSLLFGRVTIESWSWRQLEGPEVTLSDADAHETTFTAPTTNTLLVFELTATDSEGRQYAERISLAVFHMVVDRDGNGLIEIDSLLMLHNMRHNLAGTSYKTSTASVGNSSGCPGALCRGYELTRNLDFDGDGDGSTWSGNAEDGFTLDSEDSEAGYFPVDGDGAGGWLPIGDATNTFAAVFDGKGHTISNLAIRRDQPLVGLFGAIGEDSAIRNLGLVDNLADYLGSGSNSVSIGGLVGESSGLITASYATGAVAGGVGDDSVGGLVGHQAEGSIAESYATTCAVAGRVGDDSVGGLVGHQAEGSIAESYATCAAAGGVGDDSVGGLVGYQYAGSITASYATGAVAGGVGDDSVGGLVGYQYAGSITVGYATGAVAGGVGDDSVGGLVGHRAEGSIEKSYATGAVAGGVGDDSVGGLVGHQAEGSIEKSYATGAVAGGVGDDGVGGLVGHQAEGSIEKSYATGAVAGGVGDDGVGGLVGLKSGASIEAGRAAGAIDGEGGSDSDAIGGLVGAQFGGSITASYATGDAAGGEGTDTVGGLVGIQSGTITASYATGTADGGEGTDTVGGLVGVQSGTDTIIASYGFGEVMSEEVEGSDGSQKPDGVDTANQLTASNTVAVWSDTWDFGGTGQIPALKGDGGALLPGQDDVSISGPSTVEPGETVNLAGSLRFDRVTIVSWSWRQLEGTKVDLSNANARETSFTAPETSASTLLVFELTATDSDGRRYIDRISLPVPAGDPVASPSGGGGGSLGLWALIALALAHPLGPWRRRGRHSRA